VNTLAANGGAVTWVKLDSHVAFHPKVMMAGLPAFGWWCAAIAHCRRYRTDGRIPASEVGIVWCGIDSGSLDVHAIVEQLIGVGLLEYSVSSGHYIIHDYFDVYPAPAADDGRRRRDAERKRVDRLAVLERDCWACAYCGVRLTANNAHVDHKIPLSRGGDSDPDNLVASCKSCNLSKGAKTPYEWWQEGGCKLRGGL